MTGPDESADDGVRRVAERALAAYDVGDGARLQPIRLLNNAVFEVDAPRGRFALRVHRAGWRTVAQIRSELAFLDAVAAGVAGTAVSVPAPIADRDRAPVVEVSDGDGVRRACSMVTWVDGQRLRPGSGLGRRAVRLLGEALGRIHLVGERFEPPGGRVDGGLDLPTWDADGLFTDASPYRAGGPGLARVRELLDRADYAVFEEVADRCRALFADLAAGRYDDQRPGGLVHNDFILGNCQLRRAAGGWRAAILDFDDCGRGWFLFDLGAVLGNLADFRATYPPLRRAFLDGYRSVRHLPAAYEPQLPLMMAARHASHFIWALGHGHGTGDHARAEEHLRIRVRLARACLALPY